MDVIAITVMLILGLTALWLIGACERLGKHQP